MIIIHDNKLNIVLWKNLWYYLAIFSFRQLFYDLPFNFFSCSRGKTWIIKYLHISGNNLRDRHECLRTVNHSTPRNSTSVESWISRDIRKLIQYRHSSVMCYLITNPRDFSIYFSATDAGSFPDLWESFGGGGGGERGDNLPSWEIFQSRSYKKILYTNIKKCDALKCNV